LTDGAKNHIGHEFGLSLQEVEEFTNWLYSRKVDESREHQYSYYTRQSTSGAQGESDDEPDEPEIPDNPALGPDRGAAYGSAIEPYQHVQDVSMGDSNPTTSHMESKKGGRPDKVDKDGASRPSLGTSSSSDRYKRSRSHESSEKPYFHVIIPEERPEASPPSHRSGRHLSVDLFRRHGLSGKKQLDTLFRELLKRHNFRAHLHDCLTVHLHHHQLLNCQPPENQMCGDIMQSLQLFMQEVVKSHYDQRNLETQFEKVKKGGMQTLEFLSSEVHALSLYDPHISMSVQAPHGIYITST
jgi:hypothetical protein